MIDNRIVRCSDGHLYTIRWVPLFSLTAVRLGPTRRFGRCPVDHRWRITELVDPGTLNEKEFEEASRHHAGLL